MSLTPEQVQIIKTTVPVLQEHGATITTLFYSNILEEHPELNNVFNHTNQVNNHQAKALAGSLYAYASHIDDLGALSPAVEKICHKHASLYIRPEHYPIVGEGVLRAMKSVLGDACTPAITEAWAAAYQQLANIFIQREEQLYAEAKGWTDWRDFTISDKVKESDEITSFYFKPTDGHPLPDFLPGQYTSVLVDVPHFGYKQSRQYSLSDAPNQDYYRVSIKREVGLNPNEPGAEAHPGWISNILHSEKNVGDVVQLSHPAGVFFYDPLKDQAGPVVLLSAGVGITPMVSILNTLVQRESKQQISFIHGTRNTSVQAFASHISGTTAARSNVHSVIFVKNPVPGKDEGGVHYHHSGRLDLTRLDRHADLHLDDDKTKYFVCGPEEFMATVYRGLQTMAVEPERIKMEVFGTGEIPNEPH
ncbi:related to flavohemo [Lecanosticta acicola]|uniref:nitric oxide dioxygenase n=1 Tax=Lecanosticta acicola TaxID=111012 RepID=A0AAI8W0Y6_9PEZI|nr:related to flavohemo [Lecanosticta acicola]